MPPQRILSATSRASRRLYQAGGPWNANRKQPLSAPPRTAAAMTASASCGTCASACTNHSTAPLARRAPAWSCAPRLAGASTYSQACRPQTAATAASALPETTMICSGCCTRAARAALRAPLHHRARGSRRRCRSPSSFRAVRQRRLRLGCEALAQDARGAARDQHRERRCGHETDREQRLRGPARRAAALVSVVRLFASEPV